MEVEERKDDVEVRLVCNAAASGAGDFDARPYSSGRLESERSFFSIISPSSSNFDRRVVREMPRSLLAWA
jgi:hypothetical protein